jgi:hypothetical protein
MAAARKRGDRDPKHASALPSGIERAVNIIFTYL